MAANTIGNLFTFTTFGESHGEAIGGVIDGCPPNLLIDFGFIQKELERRKPGQSEIVSRRAEEDKAEFLSGIFEGKTTGMPIGFIIRNQDAKTNDYDHLKDKFRPNHADFTYYLKYGHRDWRGGGRQSARVTAPLVVGGAIAKMLLKSQKIKIYAYVSQVGNIRLNKFYTDIDLSAAESNPVRCPDAATAKKMIDLIKKVRKAGDTIGGIVTGVLQNVPIGLGEPVFDKLHADLGKAMLNINAAKGFDIGQAFEGITMKGSEYNDIFYNASGKVKTKTNHSGGVQGGISNGEDIYFRVMFKPVSTIMQKQRTVNIRGEEVELEGKGRHDPCVLPRAVPVVEAMAALVLADHLLLNEKILVL